MKRIEKKEIFNLKTIFGEKLIQKWKKQYPIFTNEHVEKWIIDKIDKYTDEGKDPNKFSITTYLKPLQQYCNYNEVKDPSELLKEDIDKRNLRLKKYLKEFLLNEETKIDEIKELGFRDRPSEVSVRNLIQSRIKSFYSNRGASISYNMKSRKSGENFREITLTKDILKKIQSKLESNNYRLICKFESQTGLRISDIIEELTKGKYIIENHKEHYFVRNFETQKRGVMINYLFFTKELEDTIKANTGFNDLTKLELQNLFKTRNGNRINPNDYRKRLKDIVKELGIKGNIKTHSFRKYYISQIGKCSNELKDPRILTHFEGHEASYNDQSYLRMVKDIDSYYSEWLKTEIKVCVDCILVDKTNKEILSLKQENVKLKEQIDLILKEKLEFEKRVKNDISQVQKGNSIKDFTESLLNNLEKYENGEFMITEDIDHKGNFNLDILTGFLVKKIVDIAKKDKNNE